MIKKIFSWSIFTIGFLICMIGGCTLDSESSVIPIGLIGVGLIVGFFGYYGIRRIENEIQN